MFNVRLDPGGSTLRIGRNFSLLTSGKHELLVYLRKSTEQNTTDAQMQNCGLLAG